MTNDLVYSDDATNIRNIFLKCDKIVYVEGDEDILFWEIIFNELSNLKVEVESVNGAPELDKIIDRIDNGNIDVLAARDSDYKRLTDDFVSHNNILYTYGYSIENTLYNPKTIRSIVRIWCRGKNISLDECIAWIESFCDAIKILVYYDIANFINDSSICVLGDNCSRFMKNSKSIVVDKVKIHSYISKISANMTEEQIENSITILDESEFDIADLVRGHFLVSAILKYINLTIRRLRKPVSIPYESLYGNVIQSFEASFNRHHPHYKYYSDCIKACTEKA